MCCISHENNNENSHGFLTLTTQKKNTEKAPLINKRMSQLRLRIPNTKKALFLPTVCLFWKKTDVCWLANVHYVQKQGFSKVLLIKEISWGGVGWLAIGSQFLLFSPCLLRWGGGQGTSVGDATQGMVLLGFEGLRGLPTHGHHKQTLRPTSTGWKTLAKYDKMLTRKIRDSSFGNTVFGDARIAVVYVCQTFSMITLVRSLSTLENESDSSVHGKYLTRSHFHGAWHIICLGGFFLGSLKA